VAQSRLNGPGGLFAVRGVCGVGGGGSGRARDGTDRSTPPVGLGTIRAATGGVAAGHGVHYHDELRFQSGDRGGPACQGSVARFPNGGRGSPPSIWPDEVLARGEFDTVVLKEGEIALVRLAAAVGRGERPPHRIEGEPADLDRLPYSDRNLFGPYEVPISMPGFEPPFMTFIAGRGCRYNCTFCQPAERFIFGRKVRRRSPANFVGELVTCQREYGFQSALIHDDCLVEDLEWVEGSYA